MSKRTNGADKGEAEIERPATADEAVAPTDGEAKPAASGPEQQVEALQAELAQKDREIAELKDKYLRALAEQENARKRMRQQSEESVRIQRESLLRAMLPIVDNLELAVAAAQGGGDGKSIVEGVEMVLRSMHDFLRSQGVTAHEAVGQSFDPQFHEAVDQVESLEYKPNTVISEHNRGYRIGDRVLRPARVSVAKAPATSDKERNRERGKGGTKPDDVESN